MSRDKGRGHFLPWSSQHTAGGTVELEIQCSLESSIKARAQTPCWVLKGSSIRGRPQAREKAFWGSKQDLPGGENTECSSFSGGGNACLLWTVLLLSFPTHVAL